MGGTLASATVHVATDWPAFGLFFLGLVSTMGGFTAWILRNLGRNRAQWQGFVRAEVDRAKTDMLAGQLALSVKVDTNTEQIAEMGRRLIHQGEAIARIEGRLSTVTPPDGFG